MNVLGIPILTALIALPIVGGLVVALLPKSAEGQAKHVAFLVALAEFALSLPLWFRYKPAGPPFQFVEQVPWIEGLGASWHLGLDGLSMVLVLLTTALTAISVLASYTAIQTRVRPYYMMLLLLEGAMIGTFLALDVLVFYVFWEAMLVPMYLLIGVWGGQDRIRAAVKFFLYTMVGSVLMLVAILWLYFLYHAQNGVYTTDLLELYRTNVPLGVQTWMFAFNATGWSGSILQMLNHGVSTGALFLLVGVIYERRHTRLISEFGGLWKVIPAFSVVFLVVMLSSIALPGTNGFVGEFLVLLGAFRTQQLWAVLAATGVILSAAYMLWMFQRVVFGPVTNSENATLRDLTRREVLVFAPLLVLIFWMGLFPNPILSRLAPTIDRQLAQIETRRMHLREVEARMRMSQAGVEPCCPEHGAAMVKK